MQSANASGLLAASFLLLIFLANHTFLLNPTEICKCRQRSPLEAYCLSGFVLKAKVVGESSHLLSTLRHYKIHIIEVFKGPKTLEGDRYIYTPAHSINCGYKHPEPFNQDEYLFTGQVSRGRERLTTVVCYLNRKWNTFSDIEKEGLKGGYEQECKNKG